MRSVVSVQRCRGDGAVYAGTLSVHATHVTLASMATSVVNAFDGNFHTKVRRHVFSCSQID